MSRVSAWRVARGVVSGAVTITIVAVSLYFWPAPLGGSTRMVVVSGSSMEPTYDLGDVVLTRPRGAPGHGDVVVFEVPEGVGAGQLVIHRIVGSRPDGTFVTQGDNRDTPDEFRVGREHVVGRPVLHLPRAGLVVAFLRQGWVLAVVLGLLVLLLLWPDPRAEPELRLARRRPRWSPPESRFTDEVMAAAEAWVEQQLAHA